VLQERGLEVTIANAEEPEDALQIQRLSKVKTNVADVSSIAVLDRNDQMGLARILVCGVGMEVMRVEWEAEKLAIVAD